MLMVTVNKMAECWSVNPLYQGIIVMWIGCWCLGPIPLYHHVGEIHGFIEADMFGLMSVLLPDLRKSKIVNN